MLSYQHEYHAGNHADVLKHATLALVIRALQRKAAPIRVLDATAGSGSYDLAGREARRNAEHRGGIVRVLDAVDPPAELGPYLDAVRASNAGGALRRYPGSPAIARHLLRPADHLELIELHPRAVASLRRRFGGDRQVHIHERDCFEALPALVPPAERRGVALIDPSFEVKHDFARVVAMLETCYRRWPTGAYLLWHPLISDRGLAGSSRPPGETDRQGPAERFPGLVAATGIRRIFAVTLEAQARDFTGLRGSGMLVVNPPFGLADQLEALMPWLWERLAVDRRGGWKAEWLVPE
jgi:23S rRNA (adenine2030-N6)-methyltransferase